MFSPISFSKLGFRTRSLVGCLGLATGLFLAAPAHAGIFGATTYTTDYYKTTTFQDTDSSQTVNDYQVTIEAILGGNNTVYDQTFDVPFTDATVQSGVLAAQAALLGQGAGAITGPTLTSNVTAMENSSTNTVVTGSHVAVSSSQNIVTHYTAPAEVTLHELAHPGDITDPLVTKLFGPILGGQDINTSMAIVDTIDRNVITTDTFLTTQVYTLTANVAATNVTPPVVQPTDGNTGNPTDPGSNDGGNNNPPANPPVIPPVNTPAVPLPAALLPASSLLGALGIKKWFRNLI
jgi:hypothetical protein